MNTGMEKNFCTKLSILVISGTFYTSGHQAVLPAYTGVGGVAPWPVALPPRIAAVVFSILQLWDNVHRQPVRMRILTGRVRIMNVVGI